MVKSAEAFRSIGEVAKLIGVAPHVLRYWETQFTALKPMKRPDGRRYYRPADVDLAAGICAMLRDDGLTIRGARKLIAVDRGEAIRARGAVQLASGTVVQDAVFEVAGGAQDGHRADAAPPDAPLPPFEAPAPDPAPTAPVPVPPRALRQGSAPRRRASVAAPLPLFPDLDRAPQQAAWLARLTELARHLQQITPADPRWPGLRAAALDLGRAMLRLA